MCKPRMVHVRTYHPPIHFIAPTTIPVLSPVLFIPSLYYTSYNSKNFLIYYVHSNSEMCSLVLNKATTNSQQWCKKSISTVATTYTYYTYSLCCHSLSLSLTHTLTDWSSLSYKRCSMQSEVPATSKPATQTTHTQASPTSPSSHTDSATQTSTPASQWCRPTCKNSWLSTTDANPSSQRRGSPRLVGIRCTVPRL